MNTTATIDFTPVNDVQLVAWFHAIADGGVQADITGDDERAQVKAEIMRRGLDLSPLIDQTNVVVRSCRKIALHDAHPHGLGGQYGYAHCPGRHIALNLRPSADDRFDRTEA